MVTGGSRGIGRAIVLAMARQGADVAILYAGNKEAAAKTAAEAEEFGIKAKTYLCDVSDEKQAADITKEVIADFGGVDILVNNAGITRDSLTLSMKEEDFQSVINTNLTGSFHMIKNVYSHMMKKRWGRIINLSSVSGIAGNSGQINYSASKAGVIGMTKTVARELAGRGVTCNAIAPGFIETDMTAVLSDKVRENGIAAVPMKRMGTPGEIAALAVFLAGEGGGYITGEVIRVDGGMCM